MITYLGGLLSLMHGGNFPLNPPKQVKGFLWALPYAIVCIPYNVYLAPIVLILCWAGKNTGHGRGFNLTEPFEDGTEAEFVERFIPDGLPVYTQKVLIMALTGLLAVSGAVIAFAFTDISVSLLFAVGGLFKGINAMIFDSNTEAREFADGVTAYTPLAIIGGVFG